jgi:biopolymer transport protein ExbD
MGKVRKVRSLGCDLNMTPMIDVVFQLIIFFVVTIKMSDNIYEDIVLEDGRHGAIVKEMPPQTLIIELGRKLPFIGGYRISINNAVVSESMLRDILVTRINRYRNTNFPVLIRADNRVPHREVKRVMDVCTGAGIWKLSFMAIYDHTGKKKGG